MNNLKQELQNLSEEDRKLENLRIRKTQWIQDQIQRQREAEDALFAQMKQEREVLDALRDSINQNMECSREAQKYNKEFQESMNAQVYAMYGITQDKLQGMREYKNAYYRGCAFSLFLLSVILMALCGVLHGFGSKLCLFMAAFTGIQGTLLAQENRRGRILNYGCKILYLFMFPLMMVIFVCYELEYPEYEFLQPIFTIFGMAVLVIGTAAYFLHNPYRGDSRMVKEAKDTIRDIEKTARREIKKSRRIRQKAEKKDGRKKQRSEARARRKQNILSRFRKQKRQPEELERQELAAELIERGLTETAAGDQTQDREKPELREEKAGRMELNAGVERKDAGMTYEIIRLTDRPEIKDQAAEWFHEKWNVPLEEYVKSMEDCLEKRDSVPQWYVAMEDRKIVGGLGVIENDFHDRKDLAPNVCAVYTEEDKRCNGIAGALLNFACADMKKKGVDVLYLVTGHDSFYERYGWEFLCMVQGDGEPDMSRMYIHRE